MKVRVLFAAPGGQLACGEVYDLADGEALVASGDAEAVGKSEKAQPDPRPQAEAAPDAPEAA
ncbi:MAG: hypothetical protein IM622_13180 [Phenylobacterium sp.]|uniref:hypothetical protein n=1 Tax=Phenylobacterium sp. TaxID=1871053 RepID=UPI0025F0BB90|nr:hypothetical protein [Phenylobacterium sp.]MCA6346696.1 hypothetical protein [Phenylobacterium sp.]